MINPREKKRKEKVNTGIGERESHMQINLKMDLNIQNITAYLSPHPTKISFPSSRPLRDPLNIFRKI